MMEAWDAGRLVASKYRLVAKLGEGGMGAVWRADHVTLGSPVAVKLVNQAVLESEDGVKRFLNEARAAALLRSPHVVQILDHGVEDGCPFMVMELLDGESLASRLARTGTLSLADTSRIVTHVARAMTKAHEAGIVHRDLKPDNIFLVRNDDEEVAKVLDFGIAKVTHGVAKPAHEMSTQTGAILGTPYYMSPEQVRGQLVDWRTDLWSLTVIAYECVVGALPFEGATVGDLLLKVCTEPQPRPSARAAVPPEFDAWFFRGVARTREERFQSARDLAEGLRAIAGLSAPTSPAGAPRPAPEPARFAEADTITATPSSARVDAGATTLESSREPPKHETLPGASVIARSTTEPPRAQPRVKGAVVLAAVLCAAGLTAWLATSHRAPATSAAPPADARSSAPATPTGPQVAPGAPATSTSSPPAAEPSSHAEPAQSAPRAAVSAPPPAPPAAHPTAKTRPSPPPRTTATATRPAPAPPPSDPIAF